MTNKSKLTTAAAVILATSIASLMTNAKSPAVADVASVTAKSISDTKVSSALNIKAFHTAGIVSIPLKEGLVIAGKINQTQEDSATGIYRVGGEWERGAFFFVVDESYSTSGFVTDYTNKVVYELSPTAAGSPVVFVLQKLTDLLCRELPVIDAEGALVAGGTVSAGTLTTGTVTAVPVINTNKRAKVMLYLEFGGATVMEPAWNSGKTIIAAPSGLTEAQIRDVVRIVSERYAGFNVSISTDKAAYEAAKGARMRCIVTPTSFTGAFNVGGIAYISSYALVNRGYFSPTFPCFAFPPMVGSTKNVAEVIAHEFGHTFGLKHDGSTKSTYYSGQGVWAPIMGTGYSKSVVQWSKGEYKGANNKQDDMAQLASNLGYINTGSSAAIAQVISGSVNQTGVVCNTTDVRKFVFETLKGGSINLSVTTSPNTTLNPTIELVSTSGVTLLKLNPLNDMKTSAVRTVAPGRYTIKVYGEGEGDPTTTGYSAYGSVGGFTLTGTVPADGVLKSGTLSVGTR